jgi:hypothetical protein
MTAPDRSKSTNFPLAAQGPSTDDSSGVTHRDRHAILFRDTVLIDLTPMRSPSDEIQIMSRYYFHLWTGDEYQTDDIGIELKDADNAYLEAFHGAREISVEMLRGRRSATRYRFDVVDCRGRLVHAVQFSEAMGRPVANRPASGFIASASRGYDLASDLAREIATARKNLQTCRELSALSQTPPPVRDL